MYKKYNGYTIIKKLGSGSFGEVFLVNDTSKNQYAMKIEKFHGEDNQLVSEAKIYQILSGSVGFPKLINFEKSHSGYILVTEVVGINLAQIFEDNKMHFSEKCIPFLFYQMIERIQTIHEKGYLHRDLKPENFLLKNNVVYLIDFGLSMRYKKNGIHIPFSNGHSLVGTPRYASKNIHNGIQSSRRDDLESIGYIILYFINGVLPWQGIVATSKKDKYNKIYKVKVSTNIEKICGERDYLIKYFTYIKTLCFDETPNYSYIKSLIKYQPVNLDSEFNSPKLII